MFFGASREPVMVQAYLPSVRDGDKRVILVDGEAVGAVNRIPNEGEAGQISMLVAARPKPD